MRVKFKKLNFLWVFLDSINFSCLNNPSAACKVVETLYLYCKLTQVNSTVSICKQTRPNCNKNTFCLAKKFTRTNRILHRRACGNCAKFHVWCNPTMYKGSRHPICKQKCTTMTKCFLRKVCTLWLYQICNKTAEAKNTLKNLSKVTYVVVLLVRFQSYIYSAVNCYL